jgi:hypothetical protein
MYSRTSTGTWQRSTDQQQPRSFNAPPLQAQVAFFMTRPVLLSDRFQLKHVQPCIAGVVCCTSCRLVNLSPFSGWLQAANKPSPSSIFEIILLDRLCLIPGRMQTLSQRIPEHDERAMWMPHRASHPQEGSLLLTG